jgi:hypothetical protein
VAVSGAGGGVVRHRAGDPPRRRTSRVDIDDPNLDLLVRVTLDASAVPAVAESVCLVPRAGGPPLGAAVWPDVPLELYVALAMARVADEDDQNEVLPASPEGTSVSSPRRFGAVNAARHRSDDLGAPVDLGRVAAVYRAARVSSDRRERRAPVAAVARDLGVHRTDAARFVRQAREVGVLEPAPPADRYRS